MATAGFNFTDRVRRILALAREEAVRLRHEYVGTEHILFGLLREGEGVANQVLANLSVEAEDLRAQLEATVMKGNGPAVTSPDLPYTSRAKKVLELAMSEARALHHAHVGSEHLLLGLIAEEKGIAAQILMGEGASLDAVRSETLRILGTGPNEGKIAEQGAARTPAPASGPRDRVPRSVTIELEHEDGWILRRRLGSVDEAIEFLDDYPEGR